MKFSLLVAAVVCLLGRHPLVHGQTLSGVFTTSDQKQLLKPISNSSSLEFAPGGSGKADITIDESKVLQQIEGFGGSITDSAAKAMNDLKSANADMYWKFLKEAFTTDGASLNYLRVPIGASDFSFSTYTLDDTSGDSSFRSFKIDRAPSYLFSVLKDIYSINKNVKVHLLPWSPPGWMKDKNTINGGSLKSEMITSYPTYLLKAVQGFKAKGLPVYAISIQNEPENDNPTYPSCKMPASVQAQIGKSLRSLLDKNGLKGIKVIGYEHNWDHAAQYPVEMVKDAESAFAGVAFHCYGGNVKQQSAFSSKYPSKAMYITECTGTPGSDWWKDITWYTTNLWSAPNTASGLMWIFASSDNGKAPYPGSNSCEKGCRGMATVTTSKYTFNQEYYSMAHFAKAVTSEDGTTLGKRIQATGGDGLTVVAYLVGSKYSLVVLNTGSEAEKTIQFKEKELKYKFPKGLTTLWWSDSGSSSKNSQPTSSAGKTQSKTKGARAQKRLSYNGY